MVLNSVCKFAAGAESIAERLRGTLKTLAAIKKGGIVEKLIFLCFLLLTFTLSATIINIPADYSTIQEGLDIAVEGDSIVVAEGIYYENISWPETNGIKLIGIDKENCIIDGSANGSVIHYERWDTIHDSTNVIKNFTIQNGLSVNGAGIYLRSENQFILENLIVKDNVCAFPPGSKIPADKRYSIEGGGGIHLDNYSSPIIRNVQIIQNYAEFDGGGIFVYFCSEPLFQNVLIANNYTFSNGGGISCESGSNLTFNQVTISSNVSSGNGGGIFVFDGDNTLISATNSIFWNNQPEQVYLDEEPQRTNIITISYSDFQGGEQGIITNGNGMVNWLDGNIDSDPLFVDIVDLNYHLTEDSPCLDAGDPDSPLDPDGTITDMGCFYFDQLTGIDDHELPISNSQLSNYPNPFNPSTTIDFSIHNNSKVKLTIFNTKGQKIKTLVHDELDEGSHSVIWNGFDESNNPVSSGIYYYRLEVNGKTEAVRKCLLVK